MPAEEFEQPEQPKHPEAISDLEAILPMSGATRDSLMDTLNGRTANREPNADGDIQINYVLDKGEYDYLSVEWKTPQSGPDWPAQRLGEVTLHPRGTGEEELMEHYQFNEAPDGVQLERSTDNTDDIMDAMRRTSSQDAYASLQDQKNALQDERDFGLTVVSERDAKRLLKAIQQAEREE